jgi:hypothetical protein
MATELKDFESHYDTLEISPECTKTEIRESWLRLSMLYHPDLNTGDEKATEKFVKIKEAYKLLINDEERKTYNDQIGFYHSDPPPDYHRCPSSHIRAWTLRCTALCCTVLHYTALQGVDPAGREGQDGGPGLPGHVERGNLQCHYQ